MYVEDDQDIRESLGAILERVFKKVIICIDGQKGLDYYIEHNNSNENKIDIIVSDIRMPNLSGFEMLAKIREFDKEVPAVLTTAHGESSYLMDAIKVNVSHYAMKPINTQELLINIQKICIVNHNKQLIERKEKKLSSYMKIIDNVATITKIDKNGIFLEVNELFCEESGYTSEELIGKDIVSLTHTDIVSTVHKSMMTDLLEDKLWEGTLKYQTKDNNPFYLKVSAIPETNDMTNDVIGVMFIGFIATEDEQDKRETMGKVRQNIIDQKKKELKLKAKIKELEAKTTMSSSENISFIKDNLINEKKKNNKLVSQVKHYEDDIKILEGRLVNIMEVEKKKRLELVNRLQDEQKTAEQLRTTLIHTKNELNQYKPKI